MNVSRRRLLQGVAQLVSVAAITPMPSILDYEVVCDQRPLRGPTWYGSVVDDYFQISHPKIDWSDLIAYQLPEDEDVPLLTGEIGRLRDMPLVMDEHAPAQGIYVQQEHRVIGGVKGI